MIDDSHHNYKFCSMFAMSILIQGWPFLVLMKSKWHTNTGHYFFSQFAPKENCFHPYISKCPVVNSESKNKMKQKQIMLCEWYVCSRFVFSLFDPWWSTIEQQFIICMTPMTNYHLNKVCRFFEFFLLFVSPTNWVWWNSI